MTTIRRSKALWVAAKSRSSTCNVFHVSHPCYKHYKDNHAVKQLWFYRQWGSLNLEEIAELREDYPPRSPPFTQHPTQIVAHLYRLSQVDIAVYELGVLVFELHIEPRTVFSLHPLHLIAVDFKANCLRIAKEFAQLMLQRLRFSAVSAMSFATKSVWSISL